MLGKRLTGVTTSLQKLKNFFTDDDLSNDGAVLTVPEVKN